MADHRRIVERIASRGRIELEKRQAAAAKRFHADRTQAQRDAEYLVKRAATIAEYEALLARRAQREKQPPKPSKPKAAIPIASKRNATMNRAVAYQKRLVKVAKREAKQAEKRELAAIRRRAKRLPPLPYSKAPPLPY